MSTCLHCVQTPLCTPPSMKRQKERQRQERKGTKKERKTETHKQREGRRTDIYLHNTSPKAEGATCLRTRHSSSGGGLDHQARGRSAAGLAGQYEPEAPLPSIPRDHTECQDPAYPLLPAPRTPAFLDNTQRDNPPPARLDPADGQVTTLPPGTCTEC